MSVDKLTNLIEILKDMQSALLAFSGGADSTFLLKALQISGIKALAVTASSEIIPFHEVLAAEKIAKEAGVEHKVLRIGAFAEDFLKNTPERCFFCKAGLFKNLTETALSEGLRFVLDASNSDDLMDYRPGQRAASEYHVRSPLIEAGLSKSEVRELSRQLDLSTWDKPSSPCLATRIPYGRRITSKALKRIECAEDFLRSLGFQYVRVRDHGHVARIEIGEDEIEQVLRPGKRKIISETLRSLGYKFISLDLEGYKSGNMNRILDDNESSWNIQST
jgi:pyridinium-3,5-biscarboxylic acid mononucleotide sulfurtransferase